MAADNHASEGHAARPTVPMWYRGSPTADQWSLEQPPYGIAGGYKTIHVRHCLSAASARASEILSAHLRAVVFT